MHFPILLIVIIISITVADSYPADHSRKNTESTVSSILGKSFIKCGLDQYYYAYSIIMPILKNLIKQQ